MDLELSGFHGDSILLGSMEKTFGTTCHGAGRAMSRTAAVRESKGRRIDRELAEQGVIARAKSWRGLAEEQPAADRAHRIGQKQKVSIMRLLMRHTIEEKMMALKQQKMELYDAVLEGAAHRGGGSALSQKDFDFLLE